MLFYNKRTKDNPLIRSPICFNGLNACCWIAQMTVFFGSSSWMNWRTKFEDGFDLLNDLLDAELVKKSARSWCLMILCKLLLLVFLCLRMNLICWRNRHVLLGAWWFFASCVLVFEDEFDLLKKSERCSWCLMILRRLLRNCLRALVEC